MPTRRITTYYNKLSGLYDRATAGRDAWRAPGKCAQLVSRYLQANPSVLDLGVGTGQAAMAIAGKGHRLVGIDISRAMLAHARRRLPKARLLRADIEERLPLRRGQSFDLVLAVGVLEFVRNLRKVIHVATAHLNRGGLLCFTYEELPPQSLSQRLRASCPCNASSQDLHSRLPFPVYPRTWREVNRVLSDEGFSLLEHKRFQAYRVHNLNGGSTSVIYRGVVARKP